MMKDWLPIIRVLLDNLLLRNGIGTIRGILGGIVVSGFLNFLSPLLQKIKGIDLEKLTAFHIICLGILIMNLPYFTKKTSFPPHIEVAFKAIDEAKASGLSDIHIKQLYRQVCEMAIQNIQEQPTSPLSEAVNVLGEKMNQP
ncbi:hypothetical protein [Domibacillus tundrae]|uniref:hypothetical protein n=1 Tax=Domibacillus tundrae TaxID=1587527 RepID=UPI0006182628|nr:hypothetical protein [Domibacillus tundrae]